jgi:hypothetical protein
MDTRPYWIAVLFMAGMLIFGWFVLGPDHPANGLMAVGWTLNLGPVVAGPVMLRLPARWFCVPAGERVLHRMLGVGVFGWLLDRSGWNRHVALPMRGFNGTTGRLCPPWNCLCEQVPAPMEPALPSTYYSPPSHWPPDIRGAHCGYCCRACPFISIRCCCSAPSCFDSSLCCFIRAAL